MSERTDELLAGMCHGDLSPAEQAELEALLAAQPELVAAAQAELRLHRMLPLALRGPQGDWFPAAVPRASGATRQPVVGPTSRCKPTNRGK